MKKSPIYPMKNKKFLTQQDAEIWNKITKTAKPLSNQQNSYSGNIGNFEQDIEAKYILPVPVSKLHSSTTPVYQPPVQLKPAKQTTPKDLKTTRKIQKGAIKIDGRLDLHGLTQDDAYQILYERIEDAYFSGKKILLIITGKGNMGRGVLRERVPQWLASGPFGIMVSEIGPAHASHGGAGALYVRIRRRRTV